jgi:UDP-sugar pyrophosphorylase
VSYIELYARWILALQARARQANNNPALELQFAIMTSDDTDAMTRALLEANKNFGLTQTQLTVFKQGKVPSLLDNQAHFVLDEKDKYALDTKPHGHGDVHSLLYGQGIVDRWVNVPASAPAGSRVPVEWIVFFQVGFHATTSRSELWDLAVPLLGMLVLLHRPPACSHQFSFLVACVVRALMFFLQDTNGLVFHSIVPALGVSAERKLHMNSITVPRAQGDAVGAICTLIRDKPLDDAQIEKEDLLPNKITINVEYNQLEGLLGKGAKEPLMQGTNYSVSATVFICITKPAAARCIATHLLAALQLLCSLLLTPVPVSVFCASSCSLPQLPR